MFKIFFRGTLIFAALLGVFSGLRYAYLEYKKAVISEIAEKSFVDIANLEMQVLVRGNTIVLVGWATDEAEKFKMTEIVKAHASESHFFDLGFTPSISNLVEIKTPSPARTTASAKTRVNGGL